MSTWFFEQMVLFPAYSFLPFMCSLIYLELVRSVPWFGTESGQLACMAAGHPLGRPSPFQITRSECSLPTMRAPNPASPYTSFSPFSSPSPATLLSLLSQSTGLGSLSRELPPLNSPSQPLQHLGVSASSPLCLVSFLLDHGLLVGRNRIDSAPRFQGLACGGWSPGDDL